jgi:hypothetical protein
MLDPLATFLLRLRETGGSADPVTALFGRGGDATDRQRGMAAQLEQRALELGLVEESGDGDTARTRVGLTAAGEQYLAERDL